MALTCIYGSLYLENLTEVNIFVTGFFLLHFSQYLSITTRARMMKLVFFFRFELFVKRIHLP